MFLHLKYKKKISLTELCKNKIEILMNGKFFERKFK